LESVDIRDPDNPGGEATQLVIASSRPCYAPSCLSGTTRVWALRVSTFLQEVLECAGYHAGFLSMRGQLSLNSL